MSNAPQVVKLEDLPSRTEREEALAALTHFINSTGGRYLTKVLRAQFAGNQAAINQGAEQIPTGVHPMHYVLVTEFKKGFISGLELAIRMPQLLIEDIKVSFQLEAEEAERKAAEEGRK